MNTASKLAEEATQKFLRENRDLIALIRNLNVAELRTRLGACVELDPSLADGAMLHIDTLDQEHHYARKVARDSFVTEMYATVCKAWCKIQRNGVILFQTKLTGEALAQLEAIEIAAGERQAPPPPPPQKSQAEILEAQVRADWDKLSTDKFKAKMQRDPVYRAIAERLLNGDDIRTQTTALIDGNQGFRPR